MSYLVGPEDVVLEMNPALGVGDLCEPIIVGVWPIFQQHQPVTLAQRRIAGSCQGAIQLFTARYRGFGRCGNGRVAIACFHGEPPPDLRDASLPGFPNVGGSPTVLSISL